MPVGAGSIKRAAKTAANPEAEKTQVKQAEGKPETEEATQQETVAATQQETEKQSAPKKKPGRKAVAGKYSIGNAAVKTASQKQDRDKLHIPDEMQIPDETQTPEKGENGPERLGNQVYQITDELPVHLL